MRYVLGCDVGSQGTNAALYDETGGLVGSAYEAYAISFPQPGWAEQDPELWVAAIPRTIRKVVGSAGINPADVVGLSFGTQLDGVVATSSGGRALRPCLIWMDRRAEQDVEDAATRISASRVYEVSGANLDSTHPAAKIAWLTRTEPEVAARAACWHLPGSYVVERLTGERLVDYSNASSTMLLNVHTRAWSAEMCNAFAIDPARLPPVGPATHPVGRLLPEFVDATGIDPVVALGCGDEQAATLGAGVLAPGQVCDVVGTAEPVTAVTPAPRADPSRLVECHCHADPASWLMENPGWVSGGNLRWFRDVFGAGLDYPELDAIAATVPPGAEGVTFLPAMQGAMAPEWNGRARGAFCGLTLAHGRSHFARAILEASAFALRDVLDAMTAAGAALTEIVMVGGGASSVLWRQIKADVTGLPVRVPASVETTATGAAMLAGVGARVWEDLGAAARACVRFSPGQHNPGPRESYEAAYARYRETYFALYGTNR